jgi:hypothetical protein
MGRLQLFAITRVCPVPIALTFKAVAETYLALHSGSWKNPKHRAQWPSTLEAYVYPKIGNLPVKSVDRDLVVKVLEPIWMTLPETARRVRMRIHRIMDHAIGLKALRAKIQHLRGRSKPCWRRRPMAAIITRASATRRPIRS